MQHINEWKLSAQIAMISWHILKRKDDMVRIYFYNSAPWGEQLDSLYWLNVTDTDIQLAIMVIKEAFI